MCRLLIFVLDSHLTTLWESNCPFGFPLVMFPLGSSYFVFVFLSLWCLWWEVWDNCIGYWSLPFLLLWLWHSLDFSLTFLCSSSIPVLLFDNPDISNFFNTSFLLSPYLPSLYALSVINLLPVMFDWRVRRPPYGPNQYMFYHYERWGRGLESRVIHYWPFQGGTFIVVLFVTCSVSVSYVFRLTSM